MKKFTTHLMLLMVLLLLPSFLLAQRTITGTITDAETGEALIGATVLVAGTSTGTASDIEGKYSISLPAEATALVFSYAGYAKQTITVGAFNVINIQMGIENLGEVMIIGYGSIKKEDATGAISEITSKDFNKGAITSAQDLIVGKIAGVAISPSTGPGGGASIKIRGTSSLSASNDPLVVVDGIPLSGGGAGGSRNFLNTINPNDIESMVVLKDASATAIYGSRASGGVLLITTKKGKSGKLSANYAGSISSGQIVKQASVFSADEYRALITERFGAGSPQANLLGTADTDWQNEIYQNAVSHDHNINLSGGVKNLPYRLSLGYTNTDGLLKTDNFERTTVALNLNPGFFDNTLQFNVNAKAMFNNNNFADGGAIGSAITFDPTQPVYDDNSPYGGYFTWVNNQGKPNGLAPTNPLALLNLKDDPSSVRNYIINGSVDYRMPFLSALRANLNLGYDHSYGSGTVVVSPEMPYAALDTGSISDYWNKNDNRLLEFYLDYSQEVGEGKLEAMAGYSWQHFFFDNYSFSRNTSGFKIYSPERNSPSEYYLASLYGRLNYNFKDKLLLTFTLRRDGSSRFSPDARWGLFPAAAAAYKLVNGKDGFVNDLKLRVGYGVTGQQDIGGSYYPYMPLYLSSQVNAQYQMGNTFYNTLRPGGYDANIKWEETTTYNAGIDFTLLNDKVTGSLDVYQKYTKDLLNFIPVPAGTNLTNAIITNVGDMENHGVELGLTVNAINKEDLQWEIGGNLTIENNKITRLLATDDTTYLGVFTGGIAGGVGNTIQIHSVGYPVNSFFVYQQKYDDNGNPLEGEYVDRNNDGQVTPDDRYRYENPAANLYFGINTRVAYKGFELSLSGRGNIGNYIYNNVESNQATYAGLYNSTGFLSNANTAVTDINFTNPEYFSDYFVQDGSFFRLDYVSLAYTFSEFSDRIKNLRVYATAQNLFVVTNYTGIDPEVGGIDGNVYPRARVLLFGASVNF